MAATTHSSEYRAYLRNTMDIEAGQQRFPPVPSSEPTYRSLLIGTLAVMGLLQVASSVAILLHLTGYLQEVDLSPTPHHPMEDMQTEPVLNALKDPRKKGRCKPPKDVITPSAHLPIRTAQEFPKNDYSVVNIKWDEQHGNLNKMGYQDGNLLVLESGIYYVYAKTCFRYYNIGPEEVREARTRAQDVSTAQLIQYVYHKSIKQNSRKVLLMKTGSTKQWNNMSYNMYCAQQSRVVHLVEGDALFVEVSNAWMLDREAEGTYFGAIKWGN